MGRKQGIQTDISRRETGTIVAQHPRWNSCRPYRFADLPACSVLSVDGDDESRDGNEAPPPPPYRHNFRHTLQCCGKVSLRIFSSTTG